MHRFSELSRHHECLVEDGESSRHLPIARARIKNSSFWAATSRIVGKRTVGVADLNFDKAFGQLRTKGILGGLIARLPPKE
jgi:hypothetical protein